MNLRELLAVEAKLLPGVSLEPGAGGSSVWAVGGQPFAASSANGDAAEFLLDMAIAAAAIRTPDASPSDRGAGWVTFAPVDLDDHAVDRAVAWLASAHRRIGGRADAD